MAKRAKKASPDNYIEAYSQAEFYRLIDAVTGYSYIVGEPISSKKFGVIYNSTRTEANVYNRATPAGGRGAWRWQIVRVA